jgi:HSP20 family protein
MDQDNRKWTVASVMIAALFVAVIVQSVAIFGLHRKLDQAAEARDSGKNAVVKHKTEETQSKPAVQAPNKQKGSKDLFGWDMDDWDPFKEMRSMHDQIDQMFGSAFNRFQHSDGFSSLLKGYTFSPSVDIEDNGDHYLVTVDMPGVEDSRIDVKIEGETLTISGTIQSEAKKNDKGHVLRQERRSGKFQRTVTLPGPVKADQITTENKKGVLHIRIPKEQESQK